VWAGRRSEHSPYPHACSECVDGNEWRVGGGGSRDHHKLSLVRIVRIEVHLDLVRSAQSDLMIQADCHTQPHTP
jgi:hypothetical protein